MMKTKGYSKGGKMKTKGYAKGGKLDMVEGEVTPMGDGSVEGPISESRKRMLKQMEEDNSAAGYEKRKQKFIEDQKKKPEDKKKKRVTSKDKLANMKSGGKVKPKSYAKGGKVRGCGIAKKGVRPAKMR